jgi:hypothetical protein
MPNNVHSEDCAVILVDNSWSITHSTVASKANTIVCRRGFPLTFIPMGE